MVIGQVVATVTATVKHPSMQGQKMLLIQPLLADGKSPDGDPVVAVDMVGAGAGERVVLSSDGATMRDWLKAPATPVRWSVIGIIDPPQDMTSRTDHGIAGEPGQSKRVREP